MKCKLFRCRKVGDSLCCAECDVEPCANRRLNSPERCGQVKAEPVARARQSREPAADAEGK